MKALIEQSKPERDADGLRRCTPGYMCRAGRGGSAVRGEPPSIVFLMELDDAMAAVLAARA